MLYFVQETTIAARSKGAWQRACGLTLAFAALTVVMTYPLSLAPASRAVNMGADTRLFLWTLGWDLHALAHQPLALFDANIFFPEAHTLAYSENLLGVALLAAPWLALTGSLLTAMNITALLSCVLSALGAYALARQLKIGTTGALVAGIVFAFSPPRFLRLGQLHLTSVQWIPFCLASLHAYLERGRRRDLLIAALFFVLQALCSGHGALFLAASVSALTLYHAAAASLSWRRLLRDLGPAGFLLLALSGILFWPYVEVKREMGFERSLAEAEDGSPDAISYLASPAHVDHFLVSRVLPAASIDDAAAYLFPGCMPLILAAFALKRRPARPARADAPDGPRGSAAAIGIGLEVAAGLAALAALVIHETGGASFDLGGMGVSARNASRAGAVFLVLVAARLAWSRRAPLALGTRATLWRAKLRRWSEAHGGPSLSFYLLLAVFTLWASLGPRFGLYTLLYRLPGVDFIRIPSRIFIVTLLSLAVLAGAGFERLKEMSPIAGRRWFGVVLLGLLAAELAAFPIKARPYVVEIPSVDRWLASRPMPFVVAEMPVPDPDNAVQSDRLQSLYMIHSMAHWQKTISGYSGSRPLRHADLFRVLEHFPDDASIRALREWGVTYVVVHRDLYSPGEADALEARLHRWGGRLRLEHSEGEGRVYSLGPSALPPRGQLARFVALR
jgi:hypothetical protein